MPKVIGFEYTLRDRDGAVLDASAGDPLYFLEGRNQIIRGLESALAELNPGDRRNIRVAAADAYGEHDPAYVVSLERSRFPAGATPEVGDQFTLAGDQPGPVFTVMAVDDDSVTVDGNHPLAGKELHFEVEVVEIREASARELKAGHAMGPEG